MNNRNTLLIEGRVIDIFVLYTLIKKLVTPFEKTPAFKLGIIDKNGKVLRRRKDLHTKEEKNAYTVFDTVVFNIKKIIQMLPFGRSMLATYAAALLLMKEEKNLENMSEDQLYESFADFFEEIESDPEKVKELEKLDDIMEDEGGLPANHTGPNVYGVSDGNAVVRKKPKMLTRTPVLPPLEK